MARYLSYRFTADDMHLHTAVGRREDGVIHLREPGVALYGPYLPLPSGNYRATIQFRRDVPCHGSAMMDVCAEQGTRILGRRAIDGDQLARDGMTGWIEFSCADPMGDIEVRLGSNTGLVADIEGLEIAGEATIELSTARGSLLAELNALKQEFADLKPLLQRFTVGSHGMIARELAEAIGYRGNDANALYRAFAGIDRAVTSPPLPVPLTSSVCHQYQFLLDQYRYWARALKELPSFTRKQWEFVYIAQALFERGCLARGKRGIGFGVGREPLPSLFASFGASIVATDQSLESAESTGWAESGQHAPDLSPLNARKICTDHMFSSLVSFMEVDMNDIPPSLDGQFDFCWSSCALEHLGSLRRGTDFIENSLRLLKPGGTAIHTTEFNLSSNDQTFESPEACFYRRRDIEECLARIAAKSYIVSPVNWELGHGFAETVVDLPPYGRGEPHIRLRSDFDVTSIGIIVRKPA